MQSIKSYTDLKQSKILAKVLSFESADMYWKNGVSDKYVQCFTPFVIDEDRNNVDFNYDVPCWSLAALLELLDYPQLSKDKLGNGKVGWMVSVYPNNCRYDSCWHDDPVDACVEMMEKLHQLKMLVI